MKKVKDCIKQIDRTFDFSYLASQGLWKVSESEQASVPKL